MSAASGSERTEVGIEPVFYESFLAGFREPMHVDVLRLIGDFLHTLAVETFYWVGEESRGLAGLRSEASAVARDLEHLAGLLADLGGGICQAEESPEESGLRRVAEGWSARLGCLAGEMRAAVGATE